jgi:hypothetical protein
VGRLLRSGVQGFAAGFGSKQTYIPEFGTLVRTPLTETLEAYGLVYDINVEDDGLVRQLVTSENISQREIDDNRNNRNVPMEISVVSIGYKKDGEIKHLLPPQIPQSMSVIYLCDDQETREFTDTGRFGYLRHILRNNDLPVSEIIAAHFEQANLAHLEANNPNWANQAIEKVISLLRDDYPSLMMVLDALSDVFPGITQTGSEA